jgi:hypothetical protein
VARDGPVSGFGGPVGRWAGGPVGDHHHVRDGPGLALVGLTVWPAPGPAGPQSPREFAAKFSAALDVEGLVDRLVDHVHLRPVGESCPQSVADLFRAPAQCEVVLDELAQFAVPTDPAGLRAGTPLVGAAVGGVGPVGPLVAPLHGAVAVYLPAEVDGLRPSSAAMVRIDAFSRSRSAM